MVSLILWLCLIHLDPLSGSVEEAPLTNGTVETITSTLPPSTLSTTSNDTAPVDKISKRASLIVVAGLIPGFVGLFCLLFLIPKCWQERMMREAKHDLERATRRAATRPEKHNAAFSLDESANPPPAVVRPPRPPVLPTATALASGFLRKQALPAPSSYVGGTVIQGINGRVVPLGSDQVRILANGNHRDSPSLERDSYSSNSYLDEYRGLKESSHLVADRPFIIPYKEH